MHRTFHLFTCGCLTCWLVRYILRIYINMYLRTEYALNMHCHIFGHGERENRRGRQGTPWELSTGSGSGGIRESEWRVFIQV